MFDVIVIGEGISGLTVANNLARRGVRVATMEGNMFGGLILNVNELRPGPLGQDHACGADLCAGLMEANAAAGVESIQEAVKKVMVDAGAGFGVESGEGSRRATHVVVATGARLRKLGVPGEIEFEGRGVSTCADCDGPMNVGTEVVVVGGGDSALQEALVLTEFASRVTLVHRRDSFRAREELVDEVVNHSKISIVRNGRLVSISGKRAVESARIESEGGRVETIACTGVFIYVGLAANADFLPMDVARDPSGCVVTSSGGATSVERLWAVGAVRSGFRGLVPDAIADANLVADHISAQLLSTQDQTRPMAT